MGWMAGVLDDPPGFPYTPPGVDVLEGGKLTSNNVAGRSHDPLQSFAVASGAVSKPGGDGASQDALHSAGVEGSEDAGSHSKLPQPSQEEEALMCLLQHCICVSGPCEILGDVNAEELKAVYPLHRCLVDGDGCVFSALSPADLLARLYFFVTALNSGCLCQQHNFLCLHSEQRRRIDFRFAALRNASAHNYRSCLRKWYRIGTWYYEHFLYLFASLKGYSTPKFKFSN